jgi:hypothetical protein
MNSIHLVPAYGRDYTSKKAAIADFEANKDFMINDISSPFDGRYVNREDLQGDGIRVFIRYKKLTQVACTILKSVGN